VNAPLSFTVFGTPIAQGSKKHVGNGVMVESSSKLKPWRQEVKAAAVAARVDLPLLEGPVALDVRFVFQRPKGHFGSGRNAGTLKASAPTYHATKPDADKALRAIGDALAGSLVRDDCQFASVSAIKQYGEPARVEISVVGL